MSEPVVLGGSHHCEVCGEHHGSAIGDCGALARAFEGLDDMEKQKGTENVYGGSRGADTPPMQPSLYPAPEGEAEPPKGPLSLGTVRRAQRKGVMALLAEKVAEINKSLGDMHAIVTEYVREKEGE